MLHISGSKCLSRLSQSDSDCIQPNATDLRLDKVLKIYDSTFTLDEKIRVHRETVSLNPDIEGYYNLWDGVYSIVFQGFISMADDEAGFVIPRSTLVRNGVFITSGLYDSGYHGPMNACLHVHGGLFKVKPGTRLAQFLLFKAESLKRYDGNYGFDSSGNKKSEQQKLNY